MSTERSEDVVQQLVDKFRSLLDEALIVAIANDHDLRQSSGFDTAQAILSGLAQDVTVEEATGFNPSGLSAGAWEDHEQPNDDESTTDGSGSHQALRNRDADTSSTGVTSSTTDSAYCMPRLTTFNDESEESKIFQLQSMFAELKEFDIKHSLRKCKGDFQEALDDLLNVQYLKSTGQQTKGVDGFFQLDEESGTKKRKGKKKGKKQATTPTGPVSRDGASSPDHLKEMKRQDEIAYVADRFNLPFGEVSDIYYRKRCSNAAAAVEILDQHIELGIETQDKNGQEQARELAKKYGNVPDKYMLTIVQVTGSIPEWSDDIAALVSKHFAKNPWTQKLDINYSLTPLPHEDLDGLGGMLPAKAAGKLTTPLAAGPSRGASPAAYAQAVEKTNRHLQAKREAAASALQLSRRGASNPLYRQAAGYYADRAREQGRFASQATSTAADLLVEQHSTASSIDLHGVYVQDGVRIARQRVQAWWSGLGEFRTQKARHHTFTVITGLGRHSAGGVSQLRQAVAAALLQDGWRMQVETGRFVITGRR